MKKIRNIALLIDSSRTVRRDFLRGITRYARERENWFIYREPPLHKLFIKKKNRFAALDKMGIDGIIAHIATQQEADYIIDSSIPAIVASVKGPVAGLPNVIMDVEVIANMAAEHLLQRGLRRFGFIASHNIYWYRQLRKYFAERIKKAGFEVQIYKLSSKNTVPWHELTIHLAQWLKSLEKPVGCFTVDDVHGRQIAEACRFAGLTVPRDVAIIGAEDDVLTCELCQPSLSSVMFNTEKAGYDAAKLLDKLMAGKGGNDEQIYLEPIAVTERESTNILAIKNDEISKAILFIQQHSKEPIQISDVVEAVSMSRRSLQRRFHDELGHSIHDEIKIARIERVAKMLRETNLPIKVIAQTLNFSSTNYMARYFQKIKKTSPGKYRESHAMKKLS